MKQTDGARRAGHHDLQRRAERPHLMAPRNQSVEPLVKDRVNGWLRDYEVDYKPEQETLNDEIDEALRQYSSKGGGKGGNRPDVKLLKKTSGVD